MSLLPAPMLSQLATQQHLALTLARAVAPACLGALRRFAAAASALPALSEPPLDTCTYPRFTGQPPSTDEEYGAAVLTSHSPQRFTPILSLYRSQYPDSVWTKVAGLFPWRGLHPPLAIDVAVGSEGRAGVELAKRGFRVLSVGGDAMVVTRTFQYAEAAHARLNLISAKCERELVQDGAADLVTCMHGLHLVNTGAALRETYRILKPGGKLVVAWNDRDLSHSFVDELEGVIERHVRGYSRAARQHDQQAWAATLQQGSMFRLLEINSLTNPLVLRNLATLSDILNSQSYVRSELRGPSRMAFNTEVRGLVEARFGQGPLLLPMVTRLFVLEKLQESKGTAPAAPPPPGWC